MLTHDEAQAAYRDARQALREIAFSFDATDEQVDEARLGMIALTTSYVGSLIEEMEARTRRFQAFIADMEEIIGAMGSGGAVAAINKLEGMVGVAKGLVDAATAQGSGLTRSLGREIAIEPVDDGLLAPSPGRGRKVVNVLAVHGVGNHDQDLSWQTAWTHEIVRGLRHWDPDVAVRVRFMMYDDLFAAESISAADVLSAATQFLASGIWHGIGDLFRRRRGLDGVSQRVRWTAGMVVQWRENDGLRKKLRRRLEDHVLAGADADAPDLIAAHSLGSLVTYDALIHHQRAGATSQRAEKLDARLARATLMTFGSQIGNPLVRSAYAGRIEALETIRHWFHLYNRHDDVLAARVRVTASNFGEVETPFDLEGFGDHDADAYLGHEATRDQAWCCVIGDRSTRQFRFADRVAGKLCRRIEKRALLVGINAYPDESMKLEGCVNDVYRMSAILQEIGYKPDNIRVVLDERATTDGIRKRVEWLLDGVRADTRDKNTLGDERVLYFSGHGAQLSGYGLGDTVDKMDECLVPHDFDWSPERAIVDDELYELYSQLPYSARFMIILDCCHSGGMTRDGTTRVRGINPPDDIRHRSLQWDAGDEMWVEREISDRDTSDDVQRNFAKVIEQGVTCGRLGHAMPLRASHLKDMKKAAPKWGHKGPYMPVIFQACAEHEYAYEYRHGVTSYGAFTYAMTSLLRQAKNRGQMPSFQKLINDVGARLHDQGYQQTPQVAGPSSVTSKRIPI